MYCAYFCVFEEEGVGLRYYTHLGLHQGGVEGPVRHVIRDDSCAERQLY